MLKDWKSAVDKAKAAGVDLVLPTDFVIASEIADDAETRIVGREEIPKGMMGLDIGPSTIELYKGDIAMAKTIFWNGPMGVFEKKPFETGTREVAVAVGRNNRAQSIIGGGDSAAALKKFGLDDRVTFVSTGGGASMKLLEGATLPGVDALLNK
jgi:phosphoglycerate kinase